LYHNLKNGETQAELKIFSLPEKYGNDVQVSKGFSCAKGYPNSNRRIFFKVSDESCQ